MNHLANDGEDDFMRELERLDRWLDGDEPGEVPLLVFRERGMTIPDDDSTLDDAALTAKLWEVLEAMASVGMIVDSTDHLSDRELYRYLVKDALLEGIPLSDGGTWHLSPIGGGSEEDNEIYLRYYADDETREDWQRGSDTPIPPKEKLPYDRDRTLPGSAGYQGT